MVSSSRFILQQSEPICIHYWNVYFGDSKIKCNSYQLQFVEKSPYEWNIKHNIYDQNKDI